MFKYVLAICVSAILLTGMVKAEDEKSDGSESNDIQSNNPLANFRVLGIEDYYYGKLKDVPKNDSGNALLLRYAFPSKIFGTNWVTRATLPINTFPVGGFKSGVPNFKRKTGLGDLNIISAYLFDMPNPAVSFGIGPQITIPTATKSYLGSQKLSLGATNVMFNASSNVFQYGYLLTWQASVAGKDDRNGVSYGMFEPFWFWQLGQGWYARSTPIFTYDFKTDDYVIPVALGLGRVFPINDKLQMNLWIEPQYNVKRKGVGQPRWDIYSGLNLNW